jgi:hypothetical protein
VAVLNNPPALDPVDSCASVLRIGTFLLQSLLVMHFSLSWSGTVRIIFVSYLLSFRTVSSTPSCAADAEALHNRPEVALVAAADRDANRLAEPWTLKSFRRRLVSNYKNILNS